MFNAGTNYQRRTKKEVADTFHQMRGLYSPTNNLSYIILSLYNLYVRTLSLRNGKLTRL